VHSRVHHRQEPGSGRATCSPWKTCCPAEGFGLPNVGTGTGHSVCWEVVRAAQEVTAEKIALHDGAKTAGDRRCCVANSEEVETRPRWKAKFPELKGHGGATAVEIRTKSTEALKTRLHWGPQHVLILTLHAALRLFSI